VDGQVGLLIVNLMLMVTAAQVVQYVFVMRYRNDHAVEGEMKEKPKVGQTLYSLNVGNAAIRTEQKLTPVKVIKVGRKYFTCCPEGGSRWQETQYYIDGWHEKYVYSRQSVLYSSPQEWKDEKEAAEIFRFLHHFFSFWFNQDNVSLETLRKIKGLTKTKGD